MREGGASSLARIDHSEETKASVGEETVCHSSSSAVSLPLVSSVWHLADVSAAPPPTKKRKEKKTQQHISFQLW